MNKDQKKLVDKLNDYSRRGPWFSIVIGVLSLIDLLAVTYYLFMLVFVGEEVFSLTVIRVIAAIGLSAVVRMLWLTYQRGTINENKRYLGQVLVISDKDGEAMGEEHTVNFLEAVDSNLGREIFILQVLVTLPMFASLGILLFTL